MSLNLDHPYVETGDKTNALSDWRVAGATAENTDRGRLYLRKVGGLLELHKSRDFNALVASVADAQSAFVTFVQQNNSGLSVIVFRGSGAVGDAVFPNPPVTLFIWLCSEQDLREQEDNVSGLQLDNETDLSVVLQQTMREFLTRMSGIFQPPPSLGADNRWSPSLIEAGNKGDVGHSAQFLWQLNSRGQFELTGLHNPSDYREWAIQQTLAKANYRKARAGDLNDPWWTRFVIAQQEADRLFTLIKPVVDIDQDTFPDRHLKVRSIRVRRG